MDSILPEGSDITFLDADGVGVLVTNWMGGRVDVGVLIDGVEGVWGVKGVSRDEFPAITVAAYESLDLPVSGDHWTGILTSRNDAEGVFIAAGGGVWQIDFRGWLQDLRKLDQTDLNEDQGPFLPKSSITNLITKERFTGTRALLRVVLLLLDMAYYSTLFWIIIYSPSPLNSMQNSPNSRFPLSRALYQLLVPPLPYKLAA
jgi:hypothetical protein